MTKKAQKYKQKRQKTQMFMKHIEIKIQSFTFLFYSCQLSADADRVSGGRDSLFDLTGFFMFHHIHRHYLNFSPPPPQPYFPHHLYQLPRPLVASFPPHLHPRPPPKSSFSRDAAAPAAPVSTAVAGSYDSTWTFLTSFYFSDISS